MTATLIRARDITAAISRGTPCSTLKTRVNPDGTAVVTIDARAARYLGVGRDNAVAANRIGYYLRRPVAIIWQDWDAIPFTVLFTVALVDDPDVFLVDPGGSLAVPAYATVEEVLGNVETPTHGLAGFPANRQMAGLVKHAIAAGCRPHLDCAPSRHGRQYRVGLWHTDSKLLHGCIDAQEASGRFTAAWLQWGAGDERKITSAAEVRAQLTSARDLWRGRR
jgi:hypothetical protein